ncbi:MAG: phosphoserine phosphatase SerB [Azospirillum sp.]|nr:phosphoserine phosphatase SerB [Azospirillum sp.]
MDIVVTLIAEPTAAGLTDALAAAVRDSLVRLGAEVAPPDWLAPGIACDLALSGLASDQAAAAARPALGSAAIDVVAQPAEGRRKHLLIADMESTMIRQEMLDELGDLIGLGPRIAAITARAMNGEIDFRGAVEERVGLLAGLPATMLDEVWARAEFNPGAHALVGTMRAHGAWSLLVSGGFRSFTARVRASLGFDEDHANALEIIDGRLTGRVVEPILDKDSKLSALIAAAGARRLPIRATLAVGDGANDLPMLLAAGLGIAWHAKPAVAATARHRLDHADLTGLLYAQGYRREEFVTA